jgi:hypothetical protein
MVGYFAQVLIALARLAMSIHAIVLVMNVDGVLTLVDREALIPVKTVVPQIHARPTIVYPKTMAVVI